MLKMGLNKEEFTFNFKLSDPYYTFKIDSTNTLGVAKSDFIHLIDRFNFEYKWDDMFTFEDAVEYIENKNVIYILYNDELPVGYCFVAHYGHIHNVFVSNEKKRSVNIPVEFVAEVVNDIFETTNVEYISALCSEWNVLSQSIFHKNNFKVITDGQN